MFGENYILPEFKQVPVGSLVTIQCYEDDMDEQVLEDIEPRFIVMYDPDPAFVRRVEVMNYRPAPRQSSKRLIHTILGISCASSAHGYSRLLYGLRQLGGRTELFEHDPPREGSV